MAVHTAPPFIIVGDKLHAESSRGIDIDIVTKITKSLGITLQLKYCAWHECLRLIQAGKIDIISFASKSYKREQFLHFMSQPYLSGSPIAVYMSSDPAHEIEHYEDLLSLTRIGVVRNAILNKRFDADIRMKKVFVNSAEQLLPMLVLGRLDAIIDFKHSIDYRIAVKNLKSQVSQIYLLPESNQEVYIALSQKSVSPATVEAFREAYDKMFEIGSITDIVSNHLLQYSNSQAK